MNVSYLTAENAEVLYYELLATTPRYLELNGFKSVVEFVWWSRQEPVYVVRFDAGVVLVRNWYRGLRAEIHGIIRDWRATRDALPTYFRELFDTLNVQRLEMPLGRRAKTLRRYLYRAGAVLEGTARNYEYAYFNGNQTLIDVDIWSIVRSDLEEKEPCHDRTE